MSSLAVKFEGPYFAAGQHALGAIILNADKPLDMKCFRLELLMAVGGDWGGSFSGGDTGTSRKGDTLMVINVNQIYGVGVHEIPFAYPIPADLPGSSQQSIKTASVTFSYNLKVEAIRSSTFSFNLKAVVPLLVADNCTLPIVPALMQKNKKATTFCCIPKGESSIDAQVSTTNFVIGRDAAIDLVVNFRNNTVFEASSIEVQVQYDLFMRESNANLIWKDNADGVTGWRIAASVLVPISLKPGEFVENFHVQCPMPNEAWRTFTSRRVQTSAKLNVHASFKDDKISANRVTVPITVHQLL